mgnify:CR=1 FL=1
MQRSKQIKRALAALDVACALSLALAWTLAVPTPALAYVDPSVMTYTIQALAGVAVAVSAIIGVAFRRSRKLILKALHVDEKRMIEPDVSRIDPSGKAAADAAARAELSARGGVDDGAKGGPTYRPGWKMRLVASLVVSASFSFTLLIVAPYELIAGNEASLTFGLMQTWQVFVLPAVLGTLALTAVLTLLRGRAHNAALMLLFGLTLATYVQVLFLNGNLPSSDGSTVGWDNYTTVTCVTLVIWLVVALAPLELSKFNRPLARRVVSIASVLLIVVQAVGVGSLFAAHATKATKSVDGEQTQAADYTLTEKGLLTVSSKKNVIVFVLDMYDNSMDLEPAMAKDPSLLDEMTGFTWYRNASAVITPTRDAVPAMLTGHIPTHDEDYYEYAQQRYATATYLTDFKNAGYNVGVYSDSISSEPSYIRDNAFNAASTSSSVAESASLDEWGTLQAIYECALFRDLPWTLKPFFWFYTDDINEAMVKQSDFSSADGYNDKVPYTINDPLFADKLRDVGLSATDDAKTGSVRFIHMMGPHYPYTMDESGQRADGVTREQQAVGSMNIVSDYIRQLKEMGLYDGATIIITSDHGYFASSAPLSLLEGAVTPILLVKPPQTHEEASKPCAVSQQPATNVDVFPTALAAEGIADAGPGSGVNVLDLDDPGRIRRFCQLSKDDEGQEHGVVEYEIDGDANDFSSWRPTGWVMHYPEGNWEKRQ